MRSFSILLHVQTLDTINHIFCLARSTPFDYSGLCEHTPTFQRWHCFSLSHKSSAQQKIMFFLQFQWTIRRALLFRSVIVFCLWLFLCFFGALFDFPFRGHRTALRSRYAFRSPNHFMSWHVGDCVKRTPQRKEERRKMKRRNSVEMYAENVRHKSAVV